MFDLILGKSLEVEQKSYFPNSFSALLNNCDAFGYSEGSVEFLRYYNTNSAVATAIKLLTDNVTSIEFQVKDEKSGKFIEDHEVLDLLYAPNPFTTGKLFETELVSFYLLTGNNYLNIVGAGKPVELYNLSPSNVTIQSDLRGFPGYYSYQPASSGAQVFNRVDNKFLANQGSELGQLRNFNPRYGSDNLYGISELKACELEIVLHTLANIHNHSLLKNQARPSGLITYKGDGALSDDQITAITKTLKESLAGAANSGKATFLSGDFNWTQLSESMKDMDFATLYRRTAEAIYNTMKIPLPMISPDNMTLANMDTAKINFYDNAIIPLKNTVCGYLTKYLMPRYKNSENLIITFDESEIEVLKPREVKNALEISKAGILTRDEVRTSIGYAPMTDGSGGDIVGNAKQTQSQPQQQDGLKHLMSNLKDKKGDPIYSEKFINEVLR